MAKERRQYRRIPLGASVSFQELRFGTDLELGTAAYKDVSGGGLLLSSSKSFPMGTLLKLNVDVPGWQRGHESFAITKDREPRPLVAIGQVVRLEQLDEGGFELGIKFLNVYPDDWAALQKFIDASADHP